MNARNQCINLKVDARQIRDAILCILDSTLLHRTVGKYNYNEGNKFSPGSIGIEEVTLTDIDLTYVRVNSPKLVENVQQQVHDYVNYLKLDDLPDGYTYGLSERASSFERNDPLTTARLSLEFYRKKRRAWLAVNDECTPWEIWNIELDVVRAEDFTIMKEEVGEKLGETVLNICSIANQPCYIPATPTIADLPLVFDDRFSDIQPYLFRLVYNKEQSSSTGFSGLKKLIQQTAYSLTS